jgi:hypothetical protein
MKKADTKAVSTPTVNSTPETVFPYVAQENDIVMELSTNPNKVDVMHPSLIGTCEIGTLSFSLAFWLQETRDKQRNYYSASLHDAQRQRQAWQDNRTKLEPLHRLKLYEFRKANSNDPDFATTEPFIENEVAWWASMWVLLPQDSKDIDSIRYFLVFSHKPFRPALTEQSRALAAMGVARLLERRKELESEAFYKAQTAKRRALLDENDQEDDLPY